MYGIIWSPTPFPISVKKTSSSSSYFTSPSFVFTFILFIQVSFDSSFEDYVFQWIRLTFDIQSQFIFIDQIYLGIQSRSILKFLKSKIELQVTYVNSICIHDLGKYEQGLKHSNTFYQQFFDTCCWKWILSVLQFP